MMMALIFGEQWAAHYGIEPAVMQERFFAVLEDLYVRPMLQWLDNLQANKREEP